MINEYQRDQHLLNAMQVADKLARRLGERFIPNEHIKNQDGMRLQVDEALPLNR